MRDHFKPADYSRPAEVRYRYLLGVKWSQVQILSARQHKDIGLPALILFLANFRQALLGSYFGIRDGLNAAIGIAKWTADRVENHVAWRSGIGGLSYANRRELQK
jgi:hypothetical protein